MSKVLVVIICCLVCIRGRAQRASSDVHELSLNIPVVYNHSEGTFYQLGRPRYPHGQATSYGISVTYAKNIVGNIFGWGGIGYFKQVFGISRPFNFVTPLQPIYSTTSYKYDNLHVYAGLGYKYQLDENVALKGEGTYGWLHSFRQKYVINRDVFQVNKLSMEIGHTITLGVSAEKRMSPKLSVGTGILFPLVTDWKNDEMFFKYSYDSDAQQIARKKFSVGLNLFAIHHL
jgi:hypothetical protein